MLDAHVHFLHGNGGEYTKDFFEGFISSAVKAGLEEIYLLEHTHQFTEFAAVYEPIKKYNEFQRDWLSRKMNGSIESYLAFIQNVKSGPYPVKVRFGLEVCYIPETENKLEAILDEYDFDFLTGSVHWIDGWGFDHKDQKDLWKNKNINKAYTRYYQIMCDLCESGMFDGLAHPDSIKCFGYAPDFDLTDIYNELSMLLGKHGMYTENSGGLRLNYNPDLELGLNRKLLEAFKESGVTILTASDAHKQSDVGTNIRELEKMLED